MCRFPLQHFIAKIPHPVVVYKCKKLILTEKYILFSRQDVCRELLLPCILVSISLLNDRMSQCCQLCIRTRERSLDDEASLTGTYIYQHKTNRTLYLLMIYFFLILRTVALSKPPLHTYSHAII